MENPILNAIGAPLRGSRHTGDQVQVVIRALLAAQLLVVDLQLLSGTTDLTFPAIAS
jgi:hypothetical protein